MADSTDTGHGADALLRARRTRVTVVGGGVAGLVAALEWAKIGAHVTVCEAGGRLGGEVERLHRAAALAHQVAADRLAHNA